MHRLLLSLLFTGLFATSSSAQNFVPGFEDVPIMDGLQSVPGSGHVFDSPAGRLVESHIRGRSSGSKVRAFYRETLPALGWRRVSPGKYARENEFLTIEAAEQDGELTVKFRLSPKSR